MKLRSLRKKFNFRPQRCYEKRRIARARLYQKRTGQLPSGFWPYPPLQVFCVPAAARGLLAELNPRTSTPKRINRVFDRIEKMSFD